MLVGHLIEELQKYDPNLEVFVDNPTEGSLFRYTHIREDKCNDSRNIFFFRAPQHAVQLKEDGWPCIVVYGQNTKDGY
jgi:hypothetical protein